MKKCLSYASALVLAGAAAGCTSSSPARPTDVGSSTQVSLTTDARTGVTLTSPRLLTPTDGQQLKFADQPLTLTFKNGVTTGSTGLTYSLQVASDGGFASIAYAKDGIPEGAGGQTAVKIDTLPGPAAKTYFWRVRSVSGSITGLFSPAHSFTVGPQVVIQAPAIVSPGQGGTLNGTASLIVTNAAKSGPAGPLFYRFEVSDSSSFGNLVFVGTVPEGSGQTSVQVNVTLSSNATYYWRVQANDPSSGVNGAYSTVNSFKYVPFDMTKAIMESNPPDVPYWPETAKITFVQFRADALIVDFDKRTGDGHWPNLPFTPGAAPDGGGIQYTLGACFNISGQWYCSAVIQFWEGRDLEAGAAPSSIPYTWYYDPARWGPMTGYLPADGELIGLFVTVGNTRGVRSSELLLAKERSNVVLVPFDSGSGSTYTYSAGRLLKSMGRSR